MRIKEFETPAELHEAAKRHVGGILKVYNGDFHQALDVLETAEQVYSGKAEKPHSVDQRAIQRALRTVENVVAKGEAVGEHVAGMHHALTYDPTWPTFPKPAVKTSEVHTHNPDKSPEV